MMSMKGRCKPVACTYRGADLVCLVTFADESWGIERNGKPLCVWEAHERDDCIRAFAAMCAPAGPRRPSPSQDHQPWDHYKYN